MDDIAKKVRELRARLGWTTKQMGIHLGVDQSTVSKYEKDKQEPKSDATVKLAELAGVTVGEWLGVEPVGDTEVPTKMVRVVGEVQAGKWKEAIEWDHDDQYVMPVILDPRLPNYPLQGFVVRGTSMNLSYPDGSHVYVASTISNGLKPENGDHVLVVRRNKRGLHEATLKEYVINEDGSRWLWPRSSDPEHQAPIHFNGDDSEEVTITGIVQASFVSGPRRAY